jgi:hypothetical protein
MNVYHHPFDESERVERECYHPDKRDCPAWGLWCLAFLLIVFSHFASAQTATCAWNQDCLQWNRPTQYVDGTTLAASDIASYEVEASLVGSSTWTKVGTTTAPVQGFVRNGIKANEVWQYRVSVILVSGQRSAPSVVQVAPATVEPAPNPPVLKTVDTLAYEINKTTDALALSAVGTIDLGVTCKPQYDANGLNVVPRDLVKFKTSTRPLVVVAKCG